MVEESDISVEGNADISYSCASNGVVKGVNGCTTDNPKFEPSLNGGYGLKTGSPCYHTGNNTDLTSDIDLAGKPRIIGGSIDMGAYEKESSLPISEDADRDGIADSWEIANFGSIDACHPRDDSDGDGLDNLYEYLAGTDPDDSDSNVEIKSIIIIDEGVVISWNSIQNRTVEILWADSLKSGFSSLIDTIVYPQGVYTNDLPGATSGYYKLNVINSSYGE